ncbi:MAG: AAA family ATPase [Acidithiobacillus sp.]
MTNTAKNLRGTTFTTPTYHAGGQEVALFEQAWCNQLPVLIKGPTGCGKTRFVRHMAARLGRELYTVSCHDDLSASDLIGRHLIGNGGTYWMDGPLTRAVREGSICYLDEVVEARKDTTVVLHALSDDRRILPIDRTGEILQAPPEFMLVISYNPGYQNVFKGLKPSTRQRFVALRFDPPEAEREEAIICAETGIAADSAKRLVTLANALRSVVGQDLEEGPGTRLLISAARLMVSGVAPKMACRAAIAESLSDEIEVTTGLMEVVSAVFADR